MLVTGTRSNCCGEHNNSAEPRPDSAGEVDDLTVVEVIANETSEEGAVADDHDSLLGSLGERPAENGGAIIDGLVRLDRHTERIALPTVG